MKYATMRSFMYIRTAMYGYFVRSLAKWLFFSHIFLADDDDAASLLSAPLTSLTFPKMLDIERPLLTSREGMCIPSVKILWGILFADLQLNV